MLLKGLWIYLDFEGLVCCDFFRKCLDWMEIWLFVSICVFSVKGFKLVMELSWKESLQNSRGCWVMNL